MQLYHFPSVMQQGQTTGPMYVVCNDQGIIESIQEAAPETTVPVQQLGRWLPGFVNAHSHAFQYAMAGMAERSSGNADDFWAWRKHMYALALSISPEQLERLAYLLYAEMRRNGYMHVVEFHYLHHDTQGMPYSNLCEMGRRLIHAARKAGIGITLVPMFYTQGGFGKSAEPHQRRFISKTAEDYLLLLEATQAMIQEEEYGKLGLGIHSIRAVEPTEIEGLRKRFPDLPFHVHISEQVAEVEDCLKYYGKRPVEVLFDSCEVDHLFHLVHATHLSDAEHELILKADASVVICPTTEGNLGDGFFRFFEHIQSGGSWSIGSDSHVGLNPMEELRWLDYGQRLLRRRRNTVTQGASDMGEVLWKQSLDGGNRASGTSYDFSMEVGRPLSGLIVNESHPLIRGTSSVRLMNTCIYSGDASMISGTLHEGKYWPSTMEYTEKDRSVFSELSIRV